MASPNFTLLYVSDTEKSVAFYRKILAAAPAEASKNFAMFVLPGATLGLWARHDVEPKPTAAGGGAELGFQLGSDDEVTALADDWQKQGVEIVQLPTRMDFGWTFVAVDPDGHRLRAFSPTAR